MASYTAGTIGKVFFVRWTDMPGPDDFATILSELARAKTRVGEPLTYFTTIFSDAGALPPHAAEALMRFARELPKYCSRLHFVIEGTGFKHTIVRGSIIDMMNAVGTAKLFAVHATLAEGLTKLAAEQKLDREKLQRDASRLGYIA